MTSLYVDTNTLNVGIGTRAPTHALHIQGNAKLTGGFVDASNQPIWIPASTLEWKPTTSPPALTLPTGGTFTTTTATSLYRYFGRELSYTPTISGIVTSQPTVTSQDYILSLPYPIDSNIYPTPTIVGELWLNVQSGLSSNTFKSYARTIPNNLSNVTLRALTGTTDESLSTILATSHITLQGNLTYATPFINNLSPISSQYIPATFAQDQTGKVALNTGGNPPRAQLDIITNSNTPALIVDQKGAGNIAEFLDVGVKKVVIDGNGNVGIGTNLPKSTLDILGNIILSGSNISIDTEGLKIVLGDGTIGKILFQRTGALLSRPIEARIGDEYEDISTGDVYKYTRSGWYKYINLNQIGTIAQPATSATQIYNSGQISSGTYVIVGTQGGTTTYNIYCDMVSYGGKWMLIAQLPKNTNLNSVSLYTNTIGSSSDLSTTSYFTIPINILSNNNGFNLDIMITLYGGLFSTQTRLGAIFKGINLSQALNEITGDTSSGVGTSSPQYSNDGLTWTNITNALVTSPGWIFSISTSSGTNSYLDGNSASGGWILHDDSNGQLLGSFYGTPVGFGNQGSQTNFTLARIWVRV